MIALRPSGHFAAMLSSLQQPTTTRHHLYQFYFNTSSIPSVLCNTSKRKNYRKMIQEHYQQQQQQQTKNMRRQQEETITPSLLSSLLLHETEREHDHCIVDNDHGTENKLDVISGTATSDTQKYGFCHFISMNPFQVDFSKTGEYNPYGPGYEAAVANMLAVQHLNTGDGSIVKEVEGLPDKCTIKFSLEFLDTEFDAGTALNKVISRINNPHELQNQSACSDDHFVPPCAFLGAHRSAISAPTSIITGLREYPQVSGASTSTDLDDKSQYKKFARTIPSDGGTAEALILYLQQELGLTKLAIININDTYGNAYARSIRLAANRMAPDMEILQIPIDVTGVEYEDHNDYRGAVTALKASEYLYTFVVLFDDLNDKFMMEALKQGIADDGLHNFLFADSFASVLRGRKFIRGSPLYRAYMYTGMILASGGLPGQEKFDKLQEKMNEIIKSPEDLQFAASMLPGEPSPILEDDRFFKPLSYVASSFIYDATILLGLAACNATTEDLFLDGDAFFNELLNISFDGVTGRVILDPQTGTRIFNSTYFKIMNVMEGEIVDNDDRVENQNSVTLKLSQSNLFFNGTWETTEPFVFGDGTTALPKSLPDPIVETNLIHPATRISVLFLCACAILVAVGFGIWTWLNRTTRIVRASQPFFLYIICLGTVLLATTMIPRQYDAGNLQSPRGLNIACNATLWLCVLGAVVIFGALCSKLHRINRIMQSAKSCKRIQVKVQDTLRPLAVMLIGKHSQNAKYTDLQNAVD